MKKNKENKPISKIKEQTAELQSATATVFDKYAFQIAFGLIALIGFIIFKDYLLFNKMFLFKDIGSDTLNGSYPLMYNTAEYLHQFGFPSWSFSYGMGGNILSLWLRDPFDILLYIAGKDHIIQLIPYKEYLKVVLGGITFFMYLRLAVKDSFTCIVGSLLFAFSGFMIIGSCWYIFSYEAFNVALLLLAFEKLYQQNKGYLFPLSLAIIAASQPFNLYVYGLFLLIYTILRYFEDGKNTSFKPLFVLIGKMAGLGVLALLMSAIFSIPDIVQLLESPRGSGSSSYFDTLSSKSIFGFEQSIHNKTFLSRLFSNDLMGTGVNFKGWQNYLEAPIVYCGILSLVLLSQVFTSQEKKKKRYYLIFLLIFIIPVIFPYFRYAFWLFTGDYYRAFSFFVALAILYVGLQTLKSLNSGAQKINAISLGFGSLLLLLILASTTLDEIKSKTVFTIALFMIIAYTVSILLLPNAKYKRTIQYVLIFLLVIELSYMGYLPTNNRRAVTAQEMKQKIGYNDYSVEAVAFIKNKDKSFFRIDKNYFSSPAMHGSLNDGMAQGYYGTSSYHSFNQLNYINFMKETGVINPGNELETRWVNGLIARPLLEDLCSVKYALLRNSNDGSWKAMYDSLTQFSDIKVLRNKFALPLGFTYNTYMTQTDYKKIKKTLQDVSLIQSVFVADSLQNSVSGIQKYNGIDSNIVYTIDKLGSDIASRKKDTLAISEFLPTHIKGNIDLKEKKILFLSIPFDKSWAAKVNGTDQKMFIIDGGMSGLLLDKGNNTVELQFTSRYFKLSLITTLLSMLAYITWVVIGTIKDRKATA
jgi:uncharacterized membrane protein YfhO